MKLSLLVSLGLLPMACGGTTSRAPGDEDSERGSGGSSGGADTAAPPHVVTAGAGNAGTGGSRNRATCSGGEIDALSGLVKCREGYAHRPQGVDCQAPRSAPGAGGEGGEPAVKPRAADGVACEDDSDCSQFELGYCESEEIESYCASGCVNDGDCGANEVCVCNGSQHVGQCQYANCKTDADCGAGSWCASYDTGCGEIAFACLGSDDECVSNDECSEYAVCSWEPRGFGQESDQGYPKRVCEELVCE